MRKVLLLFVMLIGSTSINANKTPYLLGAGDTIEISVLDEEELSFIVLIESSGILQYPFIGEINVVNITPAQLRDILVKGLKGDYLDEPIIEVSIIEFRPFYILGEVHKPQDYPFHPGLTIRKAIAIGGGFTERANRRGIELKRASSQETIVIHEGSMDEKVFPGDVITVQQSFF